MFRIIGWSGDFPLDYCYITASTTLPLADISCVDASVFEKIPQSPAGMMPVSCLSDFECFYFIILIEQSVDYNEDFVRDMTKAAFRLFKVDFSKAQAIETQIQGWLQKLGHPLHIR